MEPRIWPYLRQRIDDKTAYVGPWMRNDQIGLVDSLCPKEHEVEIKGARPPLFGPNPPLALFNVEEAGQQLPRLEQRLNNRQRVQVRILWSAAHWRGFVERRNVSHGAKQREAGHSGAEVGQPIAQVRSESDSSPNRRGHSRWRIKVTATLLKGTAIGASGLCTVTLM